MSPVNKKMFLPCRTRKTTELSLISYSTPLGCFRNFLGGEHFDFQRIIPPEFVPSTHNLILAATLCDQFAKFRIIGRTGKIAKKNHLIHPSVIARVDHPLHLEVLEQVGGTTVVVLVWMRVHNALNLGYLPLSQERR